MAENLLKSEKPLPPVNEWRDVIGLPVVSSEQPWNLNELEDVIFQSVSAVTKQALQENNGSIFTTLSGGLDSTLCLAMISEIAPVGTPIHTFTAGGSTDHPDVQYARVAARLFNTIHHEIIVDEQAKELAIKEFKAAFGDSPQIQKKIDQGDVNVWAVYREITKLGVKSVIAHDGIDEQLGGYWKHRQAAQSGKREQEQIFKFFWDDLQPGHLEPLEATANYFGIRVLLPYLQKLLVEYISHIPVSERASFESGKMPLKDIAKEYSGNIIALGDIPGRKKRGFVDALMPE